MGLNLRKNFPNKFRGCLKFVVLLPATAGLVSACFGGSGEKVEFSDTSGSAVSTNMISSKLGTGLSHLSTSPSTLRQIQDDIFSPLAVPMDPLDSMQGMLNSRPRETQPQQSPEELRRMKRQNDKRKNWAFANMNVLEGTSGSDPDSDRDKDSSLLSLDGPDKKSDSVIEEFVNGKGDKGATNQPQTIEWYSAAGEGRENSFASKSGANAGGLHGSWGQAPVRDFFADEQSADHSSSDEYGFHNDISPARAAADFSAVTKQRDAFREILNVPSSASAYDSSGGFGNSSSRSSAAALFNPPTPAASYGGTRSSIFNSSDAYGSSYGSHTVQPVNPTPITPSGPLGNSVNSPEAVQQLLDPYSSVMRKPTL
jgi:hypothetical protein